MHDMALESLINLKLQYAIRVTLDQKPHRVTSWSELSSQCHNVKNNEVDFGFGFVTDYTHSNVALACSITKRSELIPEASSRLEITAKLKHWAITQIEKLQLASDDVNRKRQIAEDREVEDF